MKSLIVWESGIHTPHMWFVDIGDAHLTIDLFQGIYTGKLTVGSFSTTVHGMRFAQVESRLLEVLAGREEA